MVNVCAILALCQQIATLGQVVSMAPGIRGTKIVNTPGIHPRNFNPIADDAGTRHRIITDDAYRDVPLFHGRSREGTLVSKGHVN